MTGEHDRGSLLGDAQYVDRLSGRRLDVRIHRAGDLLVVHRLDGRELDRWPGVQLRRMPGDGPTALGLGGDAAAELVVTDAAVLARIVEAFPAVDGAAHRVPRSTSLLLWSLGAAASVLLLLFVVIPALAVPLSRLVPDWAQERIGDSVMRVLTAVTVRPGDPLLCQEPDGAAALERLVARLQTGAPGELPRLRVEVIGTGIVNAVALPGGRVGLPVGMIRYADSPEALAGVVAHEIGHIAEGHSMARVMRVGLFSVVVTLLTGDMGGGTAAVLMVELLESGFSQDQERAADAYAVEMLSKAGIPTAPFAKLFARLDQELPERPRWLRLFASHPELGDRAGSIAALPQPSEPRPILDAAEWQSLKGICGAPGESIDLRLKF